ncbi:hypothetical protein FHR81_004996 [Actinoalloteichus hoggarensis]|uniref:Uncharacterized protein n=1 Tax=Actinoalloteichus hoggarensis TaxID=1470176 RepID=A0A221W9I0_9PSEU|nr:hypothetical protein [Actinoalloteichus hoggarensis]ASO21997.1 hypothetical protein AHOG_21905 [Actinoalloteichus hoggarensis]MBB5923923.1 hypothetical protein [Actinoalloteichus hoggarensis]
MSTPTTEAPARARMGRDGPRDSTGLDLMELRADLLATSVTPGDTPEKTLARTLDDPGWVVRPSLLRRAAEVLARELPRSVDRLIAPRPADTALITAVSLHTGLPFAVLGAEVQTEPGTSAGDGSTTESPEGSSTPPSDDPPVVLLGEVHGLETVAVVGAVPFETPALERWIADRRLAVARRSILSTELS